MLRMMTGFDSSVKPTTTGSGDILLEHQSIHSRTNRNVPGNTLRKDPENAERFPKQKDPSKSIQEKDKMTVSVMRAVHRFRCILGREKSNCCDSGERRLGVSTPDAN
jgi:hypothetical protein